MVDSRRTRGGDCPEPLDIITFNGKFHVFLHNGMRTPLEIEILTKDSSSIFRIKELGAMPRESLPVVQPESAVLVGMREEKERDAAKAWVRRNQASPNADSAGQASPDGSGIKAVITPDLPMASSVKIHPMSHWYVMGFITILILFGALYFKRRRKKLNGG